MDTITDLNTEAERLQEIRRKNQLILDELLKPEAIPTAQGILSKALQAEAERGHRVHVAIRKAFGISCQ